MLLYEMLAGLPPYYDENHVGVPTFKAVQVYSTNIVIFSTTGDHVQEDSF